MCEMCERNDGKILVMELVIPMVDVASLEEDLAKARIDHGDVTIPDLISMSTNEVAVTYMEDHDEQSILETFRGYVTRMYVGDEEFIRLSADHPLGEDHAE